MEQIMTLAVSAKNKEWITPEEQLNRLALPLVEQIMKVKELTSGIANIVAMYALDDDLAKWYTILLDKKKVLPEKIPSLSLKIHQILFEKCQLGVNKKQSDKTIDEGHVLTLVNDPNKTRYWILLAKDKDILSRSRGNPSMTNGIKHEIPSLHEVISAISFHQK